jgi:phospholipid/cholesterol/gamma-HCH transport system substrate-binding protein
MAVAEDRRNILVGAAVMLGLAAVMALVYVRSAHPVKDGGYELIARFNKAEGVSVGTEVRLSGMVVGKIVAQKLDDRFRAVLTLRLAPWVKLPDDSDAAILTESLFGGLKFVALHPGGNGKELKPGDEITETQDSLSVDDLLDLVIAGGESAHGIKAQGGAAP